MRDDGCCTEALNYARAQHCLKRSLDKTHIYFEPLISPKKCHQSGVDAIHLLLQSHPNQGTRVITIKAVMVQHMSHTILLINICIAAARLCLPQNFTLNCFK